MKKGVFEIQESFRSTEELRGAMLVEKLLVHLALARKGA